MCESCYEEAGRPAIRNGRTVSAVPLIAAVYEESGSGGALHIAIEDWNLEDDDIAFCAGEATTDAERTCVAAFAAMSEAERVSAMAMHDGFLELPARSPAE